MALASSAVPSCPCANTGADRVRTAVEAAAMTNVRTMDFSLLGHARAKTSAKRGADCPSQAKCCNF